MAEDTIGVGDEIEIDHQVDVGVAERHSYRVTSDAGLFKNGKQYEKGEVVELTLETGNAFINAGDVEELS